jgi:hypothetical protein
VQHVGENAAVLGVFVGKPKVTQKRASGKSGGAHVRAGPNLPTVESGIFRLQRFASQCLPRSSFGWEHIRNNLLEMGLYQGLAFK